jgi:N-acetylglucosaminyldiphosphoundecaprenol N-acetyl-beta-D-mannosaminyltransferase
MYRRYGDMTWEPTESSGGNGNGAGVALASSLAGRPRSARASRRSHRSTQILPGDLLPTVHVDGVRLHAVTEQRAIEHILDELDAGRGGTVVTPNLDHVHRCLRDLSFGALVAEASLVVPDGMPLIWAGRLQGTPLPQRVAGSDLISSLSAAAARRGRSIFLLGGDPTTADRAAEVLKKANPDLKVTGAYCPPRGFEHNDAEMKRIKATIEAAQPNIIFVALGSPKQEYLIQRIRPVLPSAWWLGVGISFSFLCGDVRRAPRWIQRIGLEWLHRLAQDPKRLFHRYVVVGVPFGLGLMCRSFIRGIPRRWRGGTDANEAQPAPSIAFTAPSNGPVMPLMSLGANSDNGNGHAGAVLLDPVTAPSEPPVAPASPRPRRRGAERAGQAAGASATLDRLGALTRLRAMILLGGSVRSSPLSAACGRSVLDLPLDADGSVFNHWLLHATELARYIGLEKLPVRVMVNRNTPEPVSAAPIYYGKFRVERDLSEYRGTGGVLRDLAADYDDDDLILVCNAAQVLLDPLAAIATALDRKDGDVALVSHNDGTPSGVHLLRCKTLRTIPEIGFVDLKEQALPLIASNFEVTVLHCRRPTALPVRSLGDYILAMRHYHRRRLGKQTVSDPLGEDWQPAFAIVEQGASVDPRAHVHDAVVLKGGVVEAGAVIVRSIVCPGGVVRKDRPTVDQLVVAATD